MNEDLRELYHRHQGLEFAWFSYRFVFDAAALPDGYMFFKHLEQTFAESI